MRTSSSGEEERGGGGEAGEGDTFAFLSFLSSFFPTPVSAPWSNFVISICTDDNDDDVLLPFFLGFSSPLLLPMMISVVR